MGIFRKDKEPETVKVLGKIFRCHVCENDRFRRRRAQLNTAVLSFLDLDWADRSAECAVCSRCGYVHWFLRK